MQISYLKVLTLDIQHLCILLSDTTEPGNSRTSNSEAGLSEQSMPKWVDNRKRRRTDPTRLKRGCEILKDVFLIPSPFITKVPRGTRRKQLHSAQLVASAVL